jgi:hypothetical protein
MKENILGAVILRPIVDTHDLPSTICLEGPVPLVSRDLSIGEVMLDRDVALLHFNLLQLLLQSLYALRFIFKLDSHILQLNLQIADLSVDVAFTHFGELKAGKAAEKGLLELLLEAVMNDSYHSDFAVGLNKLCIAKHGIHNLFFMPLEECLQLAAELVIPPLVETFNHIGILPVTIQN